MRKNLQSPGGLSPILAAVNGHFGNERGSWSPFENVLYTARETPNADLTVRT